MTLEITCSLCKKKCITLKCGDKKKSLTKISNERELNYICSRCKKAILKIERDKICSH